MKRNKRERYPELHRKLHRNIARFDEENIGTELEDGQSTDQFAWH